MYVHSYLTMNNNSKLHKSSSIFLAAVLVAGVIAIASPSIAFAESEKYEKEYKSYDGYKEKRHSYDPYKEKEHSYDGYKEKEHSYDPYKEKEHSYDGYKEKEHSYDPYKEKEHSYDGYKEKEHSYDPYKEKKRDGSSHYDGFKCDANNFNINKFNSKEIQKGPGAAAAQQLDLPSELTSPQLLGSLSDGGLSIHIKNICINWADNTFGGFVGEED